MIFFLYALAVFYIFAAVYIWLVIFSKGTRRTIKPGERTAENTTVINLDRYREEKKKSQPSAA